MPVYALSTVFFASPELADKGHLHILPFMLSHLSGLYRIQTKKRNQIFCTTAATMSHTCTSYECDHTKSKVVLWPSPPSIPLAVSAVKPLARPQRPVGAPSGEGKLLNNVSIHMVVHEEHIPRQRGSSDKAAFFWKTTASWNKLALPSIIDHIWAKNMSVGRTMVSAERLSGRRDRPWTAARPIVSSSSSMPR